MIIVGCDFHPGWQQVAVLIPRQERLWNANWATATARQNGFIVLCLGRRWWAWRVAATVSGLWSCWKAGARVWIGDAAQIRASYVRKQKTDKRDAVHILKLLREGRFPRLWAPDAVVRDLRQLLIHRHKLVEIRARVKNGLQHLAMNRGMQKKSRLWSVAGQKAFGELPLDGWAACRREDLQRLRAVLDSQIGKLDEAAEKAACANEQHGC